ncbi:MAG: trypsin-like peptidase domain-containing protein [Dehalococcoidales bacterium]|nr:trypsin-like peptidase domain-containing protein [Dehalococcoidales bacterium]
MNNKPRVFGILTLLCSVIVLSLIGGCTGASNPSSQSAPTGGTGALPSLASIVNKILPSVVFVYAETGPVAGAGSGVILRSDGYILTNKHVVAGAKSIEIILQDKNTYQATGVWSDDLIDLAVVKIEEHGLPAAQFGAPENINVGDWVVAAGHALGMSPLEGGATVTAGIVSNLNRSFSTEGIAYYDVIQTSAAINHGNSGGPLVNMTGEVIGINSTTVTEAQNVSYAINVATARHVFEDLVKYGKSHHPYLGVTLEDLTPTTAKRVSRPLCVGALVTHIDPQSPTDLAGIQPNSTIVRFTGQNVESTADLIRLLWRHEVGDKVKIVFCSGEKETEVELTLGERPKSGGV